MVGRPICLSLLTPLVIVLTSCGGSELAPVHSLRSWPMHVPGMNTSSDFTLASATKSSEAEPQSWQFCGDVYSCCYVIQCFDEDAKEHVERFDDMDICPSHYGYSNMQTRYIAFHIWQTLWIPKVMTSMRSKYKTKACYVNEKNCRDQAGAPVCGNYPEP
jgi:hypothetical protein